MKKFTMIIALFVTVSLTFAAGIQEERPLSATDAVPAMGTGADERPADTSINLEDPSGKEVATIGVKGTREGTLQFAKDEWYLESNGITYELHMGILGHEEPDMFIKGAPAVISGFIYQHHIAPILIETPQTSKRFWREDRTPVWSGGGGGKNQVAYQGERGETNPVGVGK
jgi:hypothetical protein